MIELLSYPSSFFIDPNYMKVVFYTLKGVKLQMFKHIIPFRL